MASVNAGPEEANNLAEGRILRLTQIRFDNGGPRLTCLLDLVVLLINLSHVPLKPDARPQIKLREPLTEEE
jgi:hypothetical protein